MRPEITADEFAVWRDDPVTQGVLQTLGLLAEVQRRAWLSASWDGGAADPLLLCELKTRAEAYSVFAEGSYEDFFGVEDA